MSLVRLNKHLADLGVASRREADRLIEKGLISVNGVVIREMGVKVDPKVDKVKVADQVMKDREKLIYLALNKPAGYVTSVKPTAAEPRVVTQLIDLKERVYPVGRLDKETTGLLILTNDGTLTFKLTHPSSESEKEYEVQVDGKLTPGVIKKLEAGVKLEGKKTKPTKIKPLGLYKMRIILTEGKNRQIRRICQKVGCPVRTLKRIRIKNVELGNLPEGRARFLTKKEVEGLKKS